jgi:hypothetical protein
MVVFVLIRCDENPIKVFILCYEMVGVLFHVQTKKDG